MSARILIFGASYGSLLATKLALAGHDIDLLCLPAEADIINGEGTVVRLPVRTETGPDQVEIRSRSLKGKIAAVTADNCDPLAYDLIGLAMQEPQYGHPAIQQLLEKAAKARKPCMSIMNMPPLPYLARIPGLDVKKLRHCFTKPEVWDSFDPAFLTLCSPDPQAFRPPEEKPNVLQVTLPTNFKAARFDSDDLTAMLRGIGESVDAIRYPHNGKEIELPVKLKVHDSIFVPLAKWAMLLTGNYRCVQKDGPRSIRDAVHTDTAQSRAIYEWVQQVCIAAGAAPEDMVPFEKYARAAEGLTKPSSAARALFAGAPNIERVDLLVQGVAAQMGMKNSAVDDTVDLINSRLELNRQKAA